MINSRFTRRAGFREDTIHSEKVHLLSYSKKSVHPDASSTWCNPVCKTDALRACRGPKENVTVFHDPFTHCQ